MFTPERRTSPSRVGLNAPKKPARPERVWTDAPQKLRLSSSSRSPSPVERVANLRSASPTPVRGAGFEYLRPALPQPAPQAPSGEQSSANSSQAQPIVDPMPTVNVSTTGGFAYLQDARRENALKALRESNRRAALDALARPVTVTSPGFVSPTPRRDPYPVDDSPKIVTRRRAVGAQPMMEEPRFNIRGSPIRSASPRGAAAPTGSARVNTALPYEGTPKFNLSGAVRANPDVQAFLTLLKKQRERGTEMSEAQFIETFRQIFPSEMAMGVPAVRTLYREHLQRK
jgi:hypothetical protein